MANLRLIFRLWKEAVVHQASEHRREFFEWIVVSIHLQASRDLTAGNFQRQTHDGELSPV
jgi:hypothetical protein